jgi:hypothetical protein
MSDHPADSSAEVVDSAPVGGEAGGSQAPEQVDSTPRINPAWEPIRSELGDPVFHKIAPHLKEFDANHDRMVSKLNEQYKWARDLTAGGTTPEHVTAALQLAKAIDESPEQVYERLGQFLKQEGRMPNSAAELEAKTDDPDDPDADEQPQEDPRIAQLLQEQQQMRQFLQQQEFERASREADQTLDSEIKALQADETLNLSKDDIREVLQRAVYLTHTTGKQPSLAEVAQDYVANVRNRILSTPRPGDSAPRLVPSTGGNAAMAQQKSPSDLSREETQDLIASMLAQQNAAARS